MLFRDLTEVAVQSWSCSSPQALLALCRGPRIGCSIKMVSQRDGQDLDPEMTNYFAKGEGGGGGGGGPRRGAPVGSAVAELKEGASAGVSGCLEGGSASRLLRKCCHLEAPPGALELGGVTELKKVRLPA